MQKKNKLITEEQFNRQSQLYYKCLLQHELFIASSISKYLCFNYQLEFNSLKRDFISMFFSELSVNLLSTFAVDASAIMEFGNKTGRVFQSIPNENNYLPSQIINSFKEFTRSENRFICFITLHYLIKAVNNFTITIEEVVAETFARFELPKEIIEEEAEYISKLNESTNS